MAGTFVTGLRCRFVRFQLRRHMFRLAFSAYHNPVISLRVLLGLLKKKKAIQGKLSYPKLIKSGGKYFWSIGAAGWPSLAFDDFILAEMNKIRSFRSGGDHLQTMIFSITSRCPLKCDHCYEWDNLSAEEPLSLESLTEILVKFQAHGISNIQFSGGEPLSRFNDLISLLNTAKSGTDFWILTSGFGLTADKAQELKKAGLTGVVISLDHWDEEYHNQFRHNDQAFFWVKEAARNSSEAGLVVAFSLCANRDFVSEENLVKYLRLVKELGGSLLRILEPREVGHFKGKAIELEEEQIKILHEFYLRTLSDAAFKDMPLVEYVGYHQRIHGCFGAGDRYLYVDSKGDIHACPFCRNPVGNALTDSLEPAIEKLRNTGCHKFHTKHSERNLIN